MHYDGAELKLSPMTFIEASIQILRENKYKITGPRMAVLNVLESAKVPLSAYDIEEHVPENIPINVVTIYRVLDVFETLNIIHKVHTKEGYVRCDFEQQKGCHSFAICNKCGRADEFIQEKCDLKSTLPKKLAYKSLSHISELSGVCEQCA